MFFSKYFDQKKLAAKKTKKKAIYNKFNSFKLRKN